MGLAALFAATLADPAQAQSALGPAVAGGTGMRGTVDDLTDGGLGALGATSPDQSKKAVPPRRFALPKLQNRALPDHYPVPLSTLEAYPRSARLRATLPDQPADAVPPPNVAALPVPTRRVIKTDGDPFAPVGYEVGTLRLFPYVEQSLGYDSNPEQVSVGVKGSAYSRTEGGFSVQSNWSTNELKGTVHGGYDDFFSNPRANRPDANGVMDLRIDVTRDTKLDAEARFGIDTQRPGSPELNVEVEGRPLVETFGGTFGGTQGFGRFSVGLHGLVDRTAYDNGTLTNGDLVSLAYQNVTDYGLKTRLAYDLKPGLQPFVEFGVDRRVHDDTIDPSGFRRDSNGIGGRVGSSFEFWPQLTGTASVGYATRTYEDPRLGNLTGPTADGAIIWAATPLTAITLTGSTTFGETTVTGSSGIKTYVTGLSISHALFRYLTLTASIAYERDDYQGVTLVENTLTEALKAEYHLSRSLVLTGTLSHQRLTSTVSGYDYTQSIALVGLRLQH